MSYVKIYVHAVWSTKDRVAFINPKNRAEIIEHIRSYAQLKGIYLDHVNGGNDHLHALISMNADQNIASIMNLLKGESSHWINKRNFTKAKFSWQNEYYAVSIGESQINSIREYIRNQEAHHQKRTFQQEYEEFIQKYGFNK
jgi:putative transposase